MALEFYTEIQENGTIKLPHSLRKIKGKIKVIIEPLEKKDWEREIKEVFSEVMKGSERDERLEKLCQKYQRKIEFWTREELYER